jgi:3-hydroxyisobutyrate dehydrogenase-like beta-hydroxyacid dehydrogenase
MVFGFVGLGNLGLPMAERLAEKGLLGAAWARNPSRLESLRPFGVAVAESLRELGSRCDVVHVCVTDEPALWDVCEGGLFDGLAGKGLIVVHSTVQPDTCVALGRAAEKHQVAVIDAPVCGGPLRARNGDLLVSCGGEPALVQRSMPALAAVGRMVRHVGELGAGQRVKLAMNLLYAANVEIICQAMDFAAGLGLTREVMSEFVRALPYEGFVGGPLATGHVGSHAVRHGAKILAKDVEYADRAAHTHAAPVAELVRLGSDAVTSLEHVARDLEAPPR